MCVCVLLERERERCTFNKQGTLIYHAFRINSQFRTMASYSKTIQEEIHKFFGNLKFTCPG